MSNIQKIKKIIFWGMFLSPVFALAFGPGPSTGIETNIINPLQRILDAMIPLLMVAAFVVFLWGIIKFITSGGDEEKKKSGKSLIIYGLIGLFVMVAVWGIIKLVQRTFGVTSNTIDLPVSPKYNGGSGGSGNSYPPSSFPSEYSGDQGPL